MARNNITVLILTYNEEQHIARCINSIKGMADDVIVIDSFSTDDTVQIAEELGARVLQNPWVNHAVQFQWGLDNASISTEWVMRLDADEYLENNCDALLTQLSDLPEEVTGVNIKRKIFFMGQWIKYGAIYPIYTLRVWRNGSGRMENRWMDEHIVLLKGSSTRLDIDIVDDNKNPVTWWVDKHNSYATKEMIEILNQDYQFMPVDEALGKTSGSPAKLKRFIKNNLYNNIPIFIRPILYFIYRYIFKLGFLDGTKGYAFHSMQGYWYRSLVDLKVLELREQIGQETDPTKIRKLVADFTGLKL